MPPFSMEERYGQGLKKIGTAMPSLGLLYLGAELERAGFNTRIIDTQLYDWDIKETARRCQEANPDAVGIYCNTSNYKHAVELAKEIKIRLRVPIIFGGPHTTIRPLEVLSNEPVDYVVIGEGERTLLELMSVLGSKNCGLKLKEVNGLGFKENGKLIINPPRELIKDLDSIAFPARHLVPMSEYRPSPNQYKRLPMFMMMASRGCPFSCTFCNTEAIWTKRYRIRSVQNVILEIKQLVRDYNVKAINFWDDVWGLDREWMNEFCDQLLKERLDLIWSCSCRVDTIDKEILKKMKKAGCWYIFFGIETMDKEILEAINKRVTVEQITNALKWTKEAGIEIKANFILGLPEETPGKG